jgi:hypothetical protein
MSDYYRYYPLGSISEAMVTIVDLPNGEETMVATWKVPWKVRGTEEVIVDYLAFAEGKSVTTRESRDAAVRLVMGELTYSSSGYKPREV